MADVIVQIDGSMAGAIAAINQVTETLTVDMIWSDHAPVLDDQGHMCQIVVTLPQECSPKFREQVRWAARHMFRHANHIRSAADLRKFVQLPDGCGLHLMEPDGTLHLVMGKGF